MSAFVFLVLKFASLILLLASSALFSGAETAFFALSPIQVQGLRGRGERGRRLVALLEKPNQLLSTLLIGNTVVNVFAASVGYAVVSSLPVVDRYAAVVAVPAMTILLLIFGEITPKRIAIRSPEKVALLVTPVLLFFRSVFKPARVALEFLSNRLERHLRPERKSLSDDELLTAVEVGAEQGVLDADERSMVDGIMRLSELSASDVMTPRVDFEAIDLDSTPEEQLEKARETRFRHLPVYRGTPDQFEGFLDVRCYLLDSKHHLFSHLRTPFYVPETANLDDLLISLSRGNSHIACVTDEYGGTAGLITRNDIMGVFAGEFHEDPDDHSPQDVRRVDKTHWLLDGDASLEDINHDIDLDLEAEGADRISGWVVAMAGRFLRVGESVEAQGCRVEVRRRRKQRIKEVLLEVLPVPEPDEDADADAEEDWEGK